MNSEQQFLSQVLYCNDKHGLLVSRTSESFFDDEKLEKAFRKFLKDISKLDVKDVVVVIKDSQITVGEHTIATALGVSEKLDVASRLDDTSEELSRVSWYAEQGIDDEYYELEKHRLSVEYNKWRSLYDPTRGVEN